MSHISIALIVVLAIIIISLILVTMHNYQLKAKKESMLSFFRKVALVHDLSFTSQEILQHLILALDGSKRKLLLVEEKNKNYDTRVIDLSDVHTCKVKKVYAAIDIHQYKRNKPEQYLNSIAIELELHNGQSPVEIFFYRSNSNGIYEIKELETRARNWEGMLSGLLKVPGEKKLTIVEATN